MLAAAALWGAAAGVIAGIGAGGLAAAAIVELVTAACLLTLARRGEIRLTLRLVGARRLVLLAVVEALNVGLYCLALVTGPVIAVHLSAPVLLVGWGLLRGRDRWSLWRLASLPTLAAGLVALALARPAGGHIDPSDTVVALLLSLGSAACIGVFVTLAARAAGGGGSAAARGGLQMLISGCLVAAVAPAGMWFGDRPSTAGDMLWLALVGLGLFAPAVHVYWLAMRRLQPLTATTIQLGEPFFGAATAALFGVGLSPAHAVAGLLVLGSVLLEVGHRHRDTTPTGLLRRLERS
jgi:drug/metabolite transporter (DMT)-like permease